MGGAGGAENDDARGSVRGESSTGVQNAEVVDLASDDEEPAETWMQYAVHRFSAPLYRLRVTIRPNR